MKVKELIEQLENMPPDAKVKMVFESAVRAECQNLWLSNNDEVILSDEDETIYEETDFPLGVMGESYTSPVVY